MNAMDQDKDGSLTREEMLRGFAKWFERWDKGKTGQLDADELRAGMNQDLAAASGGPGPRSGPPSGNPPGDRE